MHTQVTTEPRSLTAPPWWLSPRALLAWWLLAGAALLFGLGVPPVQRTQEARVLECAREMLGQGWRAWMTPMLDGHLRVRKPPLCYWMAAAAYNVGGVSEGVGRVPTALLGWLTMGITFACARWLFGVRAAFFASACLLCSYLFFRYTRLAETDAPAMCFVTLGIFAFWRAVEGEVMGKDDAGTRGRGDAGIEETGEPLASVFVSASPRLRVPASSSLWYHIGAFATALAILSKGPPGFYPPLFLLVLAAMRRRWDALGAFVRCGAPLTLLVVASPWFIYILRTVGIEQWQKESDELLGGEDHWAPFYVYVVEIFKATAPWSLLMPGAIIAAIARRRDPRLQGLLVWLALILLPLCLVANKQFHYLMPLMPPMMILIGWWIDMALGPEPVAGRRRRIPLLDATFILTALAVVAIPLTARAGRSGMSRLDWALTAEVALGVFAVAIAFFRRGRQAAVLVYLAAVLLVIVPAMTYLAPRYEDVNSREIARTIRSRFGEGPYCFYGKNLSLQLCFHWKTQVPQEVTREDLERLAAKEPDIVVIAQTKPAHAPPVLPPGFDERWRLQLPKQTMVFYRRSSEAPGQ